MRYATVCSGIEAPSVAWSGLGWEPRWFSEIEKFPSAVLSHHYPDVPNHGDMTELPDDLETIDLLCGGTPCQSFSVAGLRKGLDDDRGNLALEFCRLADRLSPRWAVWENVPGVLSSNGGRDFGAILGALVEIGYGVCYRVLDAQYFGVPLRRRRVFVVGYLGDWRRAGAVLFERESGTRDTPPSPRKGKEVAGALTDGAGPRCGLGQNPEPQIDAQLVNAEGSDGATLTRSNLAKTVNNQTPLVFKPPHGIRRLTPRECERLQGFPDDYTLVPYRRRDASDAARYRAIGNSMAVPVMRWTGERIQAVDSIKG